MMLRRSGTFIDTMSSASNRAGIPSSVSATSNAWENEMSDGEKDETAKKIRL